MSRQDYGAGRIEERGTDRWQITVELPRDPVTGKRRRHRFTVTGKRRDAQKALRAALTKRDKGLTVTSDRITVGKWLIAWLERHDAEGHIGLRARDRYEGIIKRHLVPGLGSVRLQQLRADHIADMKARWLSGKDSTSKRPLAGATVHKHMVILREALDEAVLTGVLAVNPARAVTAPSVRSNKERRALTEDEISLLVRHAATTAYDVPVRFALATGVREGEILGMSWDDFDAEAGTVTVTRSLVYVDGKVSFKRPKSDRSMRTIELSAALVTLLKSHRAAQIERRLKLGPAWQDNGLIFPSGIGTPWLPRAFYRGYRAMVDSSELETPATIDFHCLRHSSATQWIRHGVDIFTVSRRLGHASAAFTMDVYSHLLKGQQKAAAEALDHLLSADGAS